MNLGSMTPANLLFYPDLPHYRQAGRLWQGIPSIERTRLGRCFAAWYTGGQTEEPGNFVILEMSEDGVQWTDGFIAVSHDDPEVRVFDPCLWIDPLGRLWLCFTQSHLFNDGRHGVWVSLCDQPDAEHLKFSKPRRIANGLMLNKPIVASNGDWLFPCALWSHNFSAPTENHPELAGEVRANVVASRNRGETFEMRGGVDLPERAFDEHMLVERRDGRLWMLIRTTYGIGQSFSSDSGRTWIDSGPSGHSGPNARFFITRLRSGRLMLINHVNPTHTTCPIPWNTRDNLMAMLSEDDGLTWRGGLMLDTRDSISYPDGVQANDGKIYVIYDRERYKAREILMAVFDEEDILAGALLSPGSKLRMLVSRATGGDAIGTAGR